MPLIEIGHFVLNSGKESEFKLIADEFIRDNLDGLVYLIRHAVGPYGAVYGVPRGGCLLANTLEQHSSRELLSTILVVDDVLTTGGSMKRAREYNAGRCEFIIGAVVFARGPCPAWITPLFQLPSSLFLKE